MQSRSSYQYGAGEAGLVTPDTPVDEAYLNGWYAGVNFASVLRRSTPFIGGVTDFPPFSPAPVENVVHMQYGNFSPEMVTPEVKLPKQEALNYTGMFDLQKFSHNGNTDSSDGEIYHSVNLFSTFDKSRLCETNDYGVVLPLLESFEQQHFFRSQPQSPVTMFSPTISFPSSSSAAKSQLNRVKSGGSLPKRPPPYQRSSASASASAKQCSRRKLSDNTRCLQKLLPGDKKMDTATLLEEAFKYIKFLQAQVIALQLMPLHAVDAVDDITKVNTGYSEAVYGKLGKLNRQQLLQLVINSPVAQAVLYSRGCCIYSVEQLNHLSDVAERKAI